MAKPKMWSRKQTGSYYVKIDGQQINLGKDKKAAKEQYNRLINGNAGQHTVREILDRHWRWLKKNRRPSTYEPRGPLLRRFGESVPATRLGQPLEAADAWSVLCELVTPNEVESAIVQGDWLQQFERKRHGYRHLSETLKGVDRKNIELNGRTAILNSQRTPEPVRLYYFDGNWKFAD